MATLDTVQSRIDLHCIRITPVAKKEQSFCLILCIAAAVPGAAACAALSFRRCSGAKILLDKICF
jgi:hypothetical protein